MGIEEKREKSQRSSVEFRLPYYATSPPLYLKERANVAELLFAFIFCDGASRKSIRSKLAATSLIAKASSGMRGVQADKIQSNTPRERRKAKLNSRESDEMHGDFRKVRFRSMVRRIT